jgi:hypothetical protein
LIGVEHCKSFEEPERAGFVSIAHGSLTFLFGHKVVSIENCRAMLTLANIAPEAEDPDGK